MGKTTTKTKAVTVSWRTLARRAAKATNPRQAALLRKEAATLRRAERASVAAAAKKVAKKTTKAGAKKKASAGERIIGSARSARAAIRLAWNTDSAGGPYWAVVPPKGEQPAADDMLRRAIIETEANLTRRHDDALVCSWLNVTEGHQIGGGLTPMLVPSEIVRALERVLERAGYTIYGRRSSEDTADKDSAAKAA